VLLTLQSLVVGEASRRSGRPPTGCSSARGARRRLGVLTAADRAATHTAEELGIIEDLAAGPAWPSTNARVHDNRAASHRPAGITIAPDPAQSGSRVARGAVRAAVTAWTCGDFYDIVPCRDRLMLCRRRVGQGCRCRAVTGLVREVLHTLSLDTQTEDTLSRLNTTLSDARGSSAPLRWPS